MDSGNCAQAERLSQVWQTARAGSEKTLVLISSGQCCCRIRKDFFLRNWYEIEVPWVLANNCHVWSLVLSPSLSARFDQFQDPKNCGTLVGAIRNRVIIIELVYTWSQGFHWKLTHTLLTPPFDWHRVWSVSKSCQFFSQHLVCYQKLPIFHI